MRIMRTSSGVALYRMLAIMQLRPTLLPVPVEPAIRRWGMVARSVKYVSPFTVLPRARVRREGAFLKVSDSMISRR